MSEGGAFLYSALNSALYEYGAEALFEPASYTDFIVTPVLGWALGEYIFVPWRERLRSNPEGIGVTEKALLAFTDPFGVMNGAVDRSLGIENDFAFGPISSHALIANAPAPWETPALDVDSAPTAGKPLLNGA